MQTCSFKVVLLNSLNPVVRDGMVVASFTNRMEAQDYAERMSLAWGGHYHVRRF